MGIFDKLFGKKEAEKTIDNDLGYGFIRKVTNEQRERLTQSTIPLMATQLYMHYWTDNLVCEDPNDQEWQNKVLFFWKAEEPFPKKSLPPVFETFASRNFVFVGDTSNISLQVGQAMPWFGMPGLGDKYACVVNGQKITIPELYKLGVVEYVEPVALTTDNLDILTNQDRYFFLIDDSITPFQGHSFYHKGKPIPIGVAYCMGGISILEKKNYDF
ncbi:MULTISPECIES: glycohydrolase toxin TNT-related protein [Niastella]|uniref:TNT domain-containing protein n=1 Tax=Niastella soli TaxID=2821487 RepID=A0ABS3YX43_9BACT|nr:glycohydrolase toxin TNT-related protein [Niastella soli]MBO9202077.1 hypothetical protein [Niastella soli]